MEYFNYKDTDDAFDKYVLEGDFSGSYLYKEIEKNIFRFQRI